MMVQPLATPSFKLLNKVCAKCNSVSHALRIYENIIDAGIPGRVFAITGANSGLGIATACGLASKGGTVVAVCRNMETATATADTIRASARDDAEVIPMACDLGSLASVKTFADSYKASGRPLHV